MRLYLRKPYREYQDPETGEIIRLERPVPDVYWKGFSIREICLGAVDGVYAGILQWGHTYNRFDEDAEGNPGSLGFPVTSPPFSGGPAAKG